MPNIEDKFRFRIAAGQFDPKNVSQAPHVPSHVPNNGTGPHPPEHAPHSKGAEYRFEIK